MREETTNTPCIRYSPALCSLNTITGVNGEMKIKLWSITIQQERTPWLHTDNTTSKPHPKQLFAAATRSHTYILVAQETFVRHNNAGYLRATLKVPQRTTKRKNARLCHISYDLTAYDTVSSRKSPGHRQMAVKAKRPEADSRFVLQTRLLSEDLRGSKGSARFCVLSIALTLKSYRSCHS